MAGGVATVTAQAVAAEDVERVKQLLMDGKRDDAVDLYGKLAGTTALESEMALENVVVGSYFEITQHLPLRAVGFLMYGAMFAVPAAGAVVLAMRADPWAENGPLVAGAVGLVSFALWRFAVFLKRVRTTLSYAFGAKGRAKIIRQGVLRANQERDEYLVALVFEVQPDDGSAAFVDQEVAFTGSKTLAKLAPGNIVAVRFDGARQHVYLQPPVEVLGRG